MLSHRNKKGHKDEWPIQRKEHVSSGTRAGEFGAVTGHALHGPLVDFCDSVASPLVEARKVNMGVLATIVR